jgi:hypothetical protein
MLIKFWDLPPHPHTCAHLFIYIPGLICAMTQLPCTVLLSYIYTPSLIYSFPPLSHPYIQAFPCLVWPLTVCATQTNKLLPNSVLDSTANLEFHFGSTVTWSPCWHCTVAVLPQVICLATHKTQGFQFCFNFYRMAFKFRFRAKGTEFALQRPFKSLCVWQ